MTSTPTTMEIPKAGRRYFAIFLEPMTTTIPPLNTRLEKEAINMYFQASATAIPPRFSVLAKESVMASTSVLIFQTDSLCNFTKNAQPHKLYCGG